MKIIFSLNEYDRSVNLPVLGVKLPSFITAHSASNFAKFHHGTRISFLYKGRELSSDTARLFQVSKTFPLFLVVTLLAFVLSLVFCSISDFYMEV